MYLPTTHDGMKAAIGWYCAAHIIASFDAGYADYEAKKAADPNYKPNYFEDKAPTRVTKTDAEALADFCAMVRARKS